MAATIVKKTAPTGKKVGDTVLLTDLFTFTDSGPGDYLRTVTPPGAAIISPDNNDAVILKADGDVTIALALNGTPATNASTTLSVAKKDIVALLSTSFNVGGGITISVLAKDDWDGKWKFEMSPTGDDSDWIGMGDFVDKTGSGFANLNYIVPYYRLTATPGTKGTVQFFAYGPGVESLQYQ